MKLSNSWSLHLSDSNVDNELLLLHPPLKRGKIFRLPWWLSGIKNLPANAGNMGLIPDPGRSHIQTKPVGHNYWTGRSRVWAKTTEVHALRFMLRNKKSHKNEKLAHHN